MREGEKERACMRERERERECVCMRERENVYERRVEDERCVYACE